jgi:hypothetical protein
MYAESVESVYLETQRNFSPKVLPFFFVAHFFQVEYFHIHIIFDFCLSFSFLDVDLFSFLFGYLIFLDVNDA